MAGAIFLSDYEQYTIKTTTITYKHIQIREQQKQLRITNTHSKQQQLLTFVTLGGTDSMATVVSGVGSHDL